MILSKIRFIEMYLNSFDKCSYGSFILIFSCKNGANHNSIGTQFIRKVTLYDSVLSKI